MATKPIRSGRKPQISRDTIKTGMTIISTGDYKKYANPDFGREVADGFCRN